MSRTIIGTVYGNAAVLNGTSQYFGRSIISTQTTNISIAAWVKPTSVSVRGDIFQNGSNNANGYFIYVGSNAKLILDISFVANLSSASSLAGGVWSHVACVRNGSTWQLYINGAADGSTITNNPFGPATNTTVGASRSSGGTASSFFGGLMDDVRFYERALSAAEVTALYNYGLDINNGDIDNTSLKAWYKMDESSGNPADSSGNGSTLTATGTPTFSTGQVMISHAPTFSFDSYYYNGVNQFATIPDNDAYSITTTNAFTASIWVKQYVMDFARAEGSGYVNFFGKSYFDTVNTVEWQFRVYKRTNTETDLRGNETSFYVFNTTGGIGDSSDVRRQVYDVKRWVHYLATVNNVTKIVKLYKDGICEEVYAYSPTISNTTANVYIAHTDNNGYFQGEIGPAKIWNRVLDDREINDDLNLKANTNGLVGSWTADGANNRLTDSVSAIHGVFTGSPTYMANGCNYPRRPIIPRPRLPDPGMQALSLNGSTQYAKITDAAQTGLNLGSGDFLIAGWFWPSTPNGHQVLWAKCDTGHAEPSASGAIGYEFLYSNNSGIPDIKILARTDTGNSSSLGKPTFNDNQPHHWAIVFRRDPGGRIQIWVDGKYVTGNSPFTGNFDNNGEFRIGSNSGSGTGNFLAGKIWNVHLFKWSSGTLPNASYQQIIEDLYRANTTSLTTNLISRWYLNGDSNDSWGTNNLTLVGSPTYYTFTGRTAVPT